jgi:hypothetical protein
VRARWLKPEFFNDRKIGMLGPIPALVYQALWCMADDGGTALCNPEVVKGQMFMYWPAAGLPEITEALRQLSDAKRIDRYSIGDDDFAIILKWTKHQPVHNPSKFRHPVKPQQVTENTAAGLQQPAGSPQHLDTSTPQHLDTPVVEDVAMSGLLITRLNQGMLDNPHIGQAMNPIPHGHAPSVAAAYDIEEAGVTQEFAASHVYEAAKRYKPNGRNRQIKSLGYLTDSTIGAWEKSKAVSHANGTSRPALRNGDKASRGVDALRDWLNESETTDAEVVHDGNE